MLMYVTSLLVLVAAVSAAPSQNLNSSPSDSAAKAVCSPMQWEAAVLGKIAQVYKGAPQVIDVVGKTSSDYNRGSVVISQEIYYEGKSTGKGVYLQTKSQGFSYDPVNKKCQKVPIVWPVKQYCSNSTFFTYRTSMQIGVQWTDTYQMALNGVKADITMLRDSFIPVTETMEHEFQGIPQMLSYQYGNATTSIADPSVFDIPSYCNA